MSFSSCLYSLANLLSSSTGTFFLIIFRLLFFSCYTFLHLPPSYYNITPTHPHNLRIIYIITSF